jgi:hypothetical protein
MALTAFDLAQTNEGKITIISVVPPSVLKEFPINEIYQIKLSKIPLKS